MKQERRPGMKDEVLKAIGNVEEMLRAGEQYQKDAMFFESHQEEWRKKYLERWLAIYREELVAVVESYNQLERILKQRGVPSEKAVIRFLSTKKRPLILANK